METPSFELIDDTVDTDEHFRRLRKFTSSMSIDAAIATADEWLTSDDVRLTAAGLDLLAILPSKPEVSASLLRHAQRLEVRLSSLPEDVRWALAHALLLHPETQATSALVELAKDPDADVRNLVAQALPVNHPATSAEIASLMQLAEDEDPDVRDWAMHDLANEDTLPFEAIEVLRKHIADPNPEASAEAIYGLARRADPLVLPYLLDRLSDAFVPYIFVDAAAEFASPALTEALLRLWQSNWGHETQDWTVLRTALRASGYKGELVEPA